MDASNEIEDMGLFRKQISLRRRCKKYKHVRYHKRLAMKPPLKCQAAFTLHGKTYHVGTHQEPKYLAQRVNYEFYKAHVQRNLSMDDFVLPNPSVGFRDSRGKFDDEFQNDLSEESDLSHHSMSEKEVKDEDTYLPLEFGVSMSDSDSSGIESASEQMETTRASSNSSESTGELVMPTRRTMRLPKTEMKASWIPNLQRSFFTNYNVLPMNAVFSDSDSD